MQKTLWSGKSVTSRACSSRTKREPQTANLTARPWSRNFLTFVLRGKCRKSLVFNLSIASPPWSAGLTASGQQCARKPTNTNFPLVPHSGLEASTLTTQISSLNIANQTATREGGQCAQTEAIGSQVQGDDITSGVQDVAILPIKRGPLSNADDKFSSGTTASVRTAFGGLMEDKAALGGDYKVNIY